MTKEEFLNQFKDSNNQAKVRGNILQLKDWSLDPEEFYEGNILLQRFSKVRDAIPLVIPKEIITLPKEEYTGKVVKIEGQLRTKRCENHLLVYIFAKELEITEECSPEKNNDIILTGYLCRKANFRITPNQKAIADLMIAVNRAGQESDYIPAICWDENARYAVNFDTSEKLIFRGRVQSREYEKECDGKVVKKTICELSVSSIVKA